MKIICHRGNTFGPDPENENKPEVIDYCINQGHDIEIDLWVHNNDLYLGHDEPTYPVPMDYLVSMKTRLWIHCKNLQASTELYRYRGFNYFMHDKDDYTLTSQCFVWTYPKRQEVFAYNQVLLDFGPNVDFEKYKLLGIHGVCVDYV